MNLPQHWTSSSIVTTASALTATTNTCTNNVVSPQPVSTTGSLTTRFKHLVQSFHHPNSNSSGGGSSGSHGGVFSGASFAHVHGTGLVDSRTSSKPMDSSGRQPCSRNKPWVNGTSLDATGNTTGVISTGSFSCVPRSSASVGGVLKQDLFAVPAEVRYPSRNYATVDLRPSPASSVNTNAKLSLGASCHQLPNSRVDETASAGSSAASILGFSTSTSTGSDCTSDAATLTSDTMDGCVGPVNTNYANPPRLQTGSTGPTGTPPQTTEFARRRHSHSLSSAIFDPPVLNYVHVIAATAPLSTPNATRRDGSGIVSEPIVCSIPEHAHSHSSSGGLGGLALNSITPPLVPASSASFGDIFTSRSMTPSATSSGEGENAAVEAGFQSYSPPDDVSYTLIDITRTMALGELSGDMTEQQQQQEHQHNSAGTASKEGTTNIHFRWPQHKPATDRSTSVSKSLSRSIRSIRRGAQKKPSVSLNNNG